MMTSPVSAVPAAPSDRALAHFSAAFEYETDCADVHAAFEGGHPDFVLFDVRGPALYAAGVTGSIEAGLQKAREAIASGAAIAKLEQFVQVTRQLGAVN